MTQAVHNQIIPLQVIWEQQPTDQPLLFGVSMCEVI